MQILKKAAPAECSCRSLWEQGDLTVLFRSGFSAASRSGCSQLPSLWPSINSVNKIKGQNLFSKDLVNIQCKKWPAHLHCGELCLTNSQNQWAHVKINESQANTACDDAPSTVVPQVLHQTHQVKHPRELLKAAGMPLYYSTCAASSVHCHSPPLLQHHCPPHELGDYPNYSSCCATPHRT